MKSRYILPLVALLLMASCERNNDFVEPSFLHVDAITLVPPSQNAITLEAGFYTSDIVAAYVVAHRPEAHSVDTLGLFQLPFTIPVLYSGELDYLEIYPAIEQSGSSGFLPFYTFYNRIRLDNVTLTSGDTLSFGTLTTTYNIRTSDVLMYEMFEPTEGSLLFDSVMQWRPIAPDEACSGVGYGYVPVPDSVLTLSFSIDRDFEVRDASKLIYLELDTRSDVEYWVYMQSSVTQGAAPTLYPVMAIRPSTDWRHIYVNLGRTWTIFNHNPDFRILFTAVNNDNTGGEVRLDNVRLLTTSVVL